MLTHLALQIHLLDPLTSIVDFLLDGHAFVKGGLTLLSSSASHSLFDSLPALLERLITALHHDTIVLSASVNLLKLLIFFLIRKLLLLEALLVLFLLLVLDSFPLEDVLFK